MRGELQIKMQAKEFAELYVFCKNPEIPEGEKCKAQIFAVSPPSSLFQAKGKDRGRGKEGEGRGEEGITLPSLGFRIANIIWLQ
ncbi:conserved hypothetical protein [Ricinus communis]|uniref:Uncharacterized protein n=1 Tax=Ricinus communis TaxID=3988 RepID=B9SYV9_RICCO|nr:conserved hypothetical protein [Ricinus communis]